MPATLSLTLGAPVSFGAFTPGVARTYAASTTANVISTAGDATLSVVDPSTNPRPPGQRHVRAGAAARGQRPARPPSPPLSGSAADAEDLHRPGQPTTRSTLDFQQRIGANDPLRTGTYSKTLTYTLSTTNP